MNWQLGNKQWHCAVTLVASSKCSICISLVHFRCAVNFYLKVDQAMQVMIILVVMGGGSVSEYCPS